MAKKTARQWVLEGLQWLAENREKSSKYVSRNWISAESRDPDTQMTRDDFAAHLAAEGAELRQLIERVKKGEHLWSVNMPL